MRRGRERKSLGDSEVFRGERVDVNKMSSVIIPVLVSKAFVEISYFRGSN